MANENGLGVVEVKRFSTRNFRLESGEVLPELNSRTRPTERSRPTDATRSSLPMATLRASTRRDSTPMASPDGGTG